jgi:formamidopyrimidine-DNA glycosylase
MLIHTKMGCLGVHLGMSGRFVAAEKAEPLAPHTHALFDIEKSLQFRFIDPRRFGRLFSLEKNEILSHPFLIKLGVEPLEEKTDLGRHLFDASRSRSQAIKVFLMDSEVVVGVGNIYASESLWRAKINPQMPAKTLGLSHYRKLAAQIRSVLNDAIDAGGTTLRDYRDKDGKPGYFQTNLAVYGKESMPCPRCQTTVSRITQAARSTFFCPLCQK